MSALSGRFLDRISFPREFVDDVGGKRIEGRALTEQRRQKFALAALRVDSASLPSTAGVS